MGQISRRPRLFLGSQDQCRLSQQQRLRLQNTLPGVPEFILVGLHPLCTGRDPCSCLRPHGGPPLPRPVPSFRVATGSLPLPRGWGGCPWGSRGSLPPPKAPYPWGEPRANQAEGQGVGTWGGPPDWGLPFPPDLSSEDSRSRLCPQQTMLHS